MIVTNAPATSGPWLTINRRFGRGLEIVAATDPFFTLAQVVGYSSNQRANAALMTASPQLLKLLRETLELVETYRERVMRGRIHGDLIEHDARVAGEARKLVDVLSGPPAEPLETNDLRDALRRMIADGTLSRRNYGDPSRCAANAERVKAVGH